MPEMFVTLSFVWDDQTTLERDFLIAPKQMELHINQDDTIYSLIAIA